jgi:hypothetical protein
MSGDSDKGVDCLKMYASGSGVADVEKFEAAGSVSRIPLSLAC